MMVLELLGFAADVLHEQVSDARDGDEPDDVQRILIGRVELDPRRETPRADH